MRASSFLMLMLAQVRCANAAFVPTKSMMAPRMCQLGGYRDYGGEGGNNAKRARSQQVPLIGPTPGGPPLFIGGEMTLDPPTPLQWQALEESVILHQQYLNEQQAGDGTTAMTTGVDASPLVVVIDDVTGKEKDGTRPGRYATLAAVVGISSSAKTSSKLDTSDETSFMESLTTAGMGRSPLNSCIRLVGVGRASLKHFVYKLPTNLDENDDEDDECEIHEGEVLSAAHDGEEGDGGELSIAEANDHLSAAREKDYIRAEVDEEEYIDDVDEDEPEEEERQTPIVMAEFTVIRDAFVSSTSDPNSIGEKGARSLQSSPIHAVAETNKLLNRVIYLHDDRRRLVKGLQAAKARLEQANVFEDYDGIGLVTSKDDEDGQEIIEEFLAKYHHENLPKLDTRTSVIAAMENYGLNYYSSFASVPQLTSVALQTFEPYYSQECRESEEYEQEISSFVAFRALDGFCTAQDMAWALQCTNTIERLNAAYSIMLRHKQLLEQLAEYASRDLRDCGEECTDLW